jgi:phosphatidylserine/phosphatidylglycerophosphate/cardiolipin synthase-like enzyme
VRGLLFSLGLAIAGCSGHIGASGGGADGDGPDASLDDAGAARDGASGPGDAGDAFDAGAVPPADDLGAPPPVDMSAPPPPPPPPPDVDMGAPPPVDMGAPPPDVDMGTPPPPPPPPPTFPTYETVFSRRPATNGRDTTVEDRLVQLIDAAVPGSRIRGALYTFTRTGPADALGRAAARGVDVKIILDGGADGAGSEVGTLRTGLGTGNVRLCDSPGTACVGSGIMHHKTFLFSALADGSTNVVAQASHNLTANQLQMHNNAIIVRGDATLFAAYERTWNDLFADVEIPDYYRLTDGDLATRVYFFPRPGGGDTTVSILDNVACDGTARIRVAMAFFTDARLEVAQALARRAREGCDVQVIAGNAEIPLGGSVETTLTGAGVRLFKYPDRSGWGLHSKYMIIDANYAGSAAHRRLVFTGSHNWTGPALSINDETMLRVEDNGVFDAYLADWNHVRVESARP